MTSILRIRLATDLVNQIKLYTGEVVLRNGTPMHQIPKNDKRRSLLNRMAKIKQLHCAVDYTEHDRRGAVWFKTPDTMKHVVISVYYDVLYRRYVWEMRILGKEEVRVGI